VSETNETGKKHIYISVKKDTHKAVLIQITAIYV